MGRRGNSAFTRGAPRLHGGAGRANIHAGCNANTFVDRQSAVPSQVDVFNHDHRVKGVVEIVPRIGADEVFSQLPRGRVGHPL